MIASPFSLRWVLYYSCTTFLNDIVGRMGKCAEPILEPALRKMRIGRVLRPKGVLAGTVPSTYAKPVLEFLSNPDEIRDHKQYYTRDSLFALFSKTGFIGITHSYFQFGMNNYFTACTV